MSLLLISNVAFKGHAQEAPRRCDILLHNGTIHPGDGSEPLIGDVAITDGKIVSVGSVEEFLGDMQIDCTGLIVSPGFIDLHSHSDRGIRTKSGRANVNFLMQGCTTVLTGNCGFGPVNVGAYLKDVDEQGAGTHVAHLLPQGSLRRQVIGDVDREPTDEELNEMRQLTDQALRDGAFGMSTGLIYLPGAFSSTEELIEIARVVSRHGGIYASHIRGEGGTLLNSIQEAIRIGTEADLPVHVSHFKAIGKPNWGTLRLAIDMIKQARDKGQRVTADQYPYTASSTSLQATLFPAWAREGGRAKLLERLDDPERQDQIRDIILERLDRSERIQIASYSRGRHWVGMSLEEIAAQENRDVVDLAIEIERSGGASIVNFGMHEEDMRQAMPLPWVATASDGSTRIPSATRPHPRSYGTFPRKIGRYAIELEVLPVADAIRSATGLPAEIMGLTDRGLLREGLAADIAVFDPETFRDRATFEEPFLLPAGIRYVLVEGTFAVHDGHPTGALAGRALRKPPREE